MNCRISILLTLLVMGLAPKLSAQGTAFSYQGQLSDAGTPASAVYAFQFRIFNALTNGSQIGMTLTNTHVPVTNGLFNVTLDFGASIFTGTNCWLDIAVKKTNEVSYTALAPRQPILPVPYAIFATTASNLSGSLPATQLSGTVPSSQISGTYASPVNFTSGGNTFAGSGSNLTSLNASQLTSGTLADARLTANVALLDRNNQTYSGANIMTNTGNRFTGSFFGNGNVGWDAFAGPTVQAEFNHGYVLTNAQFTTVNLPATPISSDSTNIGHIVRISGAGVGGWRVGQGTNQSIAGNFLSYKNSAWVQAEAGLGSWRCLASSADGSMMYAGAANLNGIYFSTDYGRKWGTFAVSGTGWYGIACSADGSSVYAVPYGGNIQYSLDSGTTWSFVASSARNWSSIACSANGSRILAAVNGERLYLCTNSSTMVWNSTGPTSNQTWSSVASSANGTNLAAAISGGGIYTSTNGGTSWANNVGLNANWQSVIVSADGSRVVAAAYNNTIYFSTNSGVSWAKSSAPTNYWTCLTASGDCTRLIAGASNSVLYASVNFGASWTALSTPTGQAWAALTTSLDGSKAVAGVNNSVTGGLYYSGNSTQIITLTSTNGFLSGSFGSAVELQYIGGGRFMPVSSTGTLWAN
jgi:hypothetical protein